MSAKEITIDIMFKKQLSKTEHGKQIEVKCPACDIKVPKNKLNMHLDTICSSSNCKKNVPDCQNVDICKKEYVTEAAAVKLIRDCSPIQKQSDSNSGFITSLPMNSNSSELGVELQKEDPIVERPYTRLSLKRSLTVPFENKSKKSKSSEVGITTVDCSNCIECVNQNVALNINQKTANLSDNSLTFKCEKVIACHEETIKNYEEHLLVKDEFQNDSYEHMPKEENPYYWINFKHIIDSVVGNEDDFRLFNDEDKSYINHFQNASESAQKLYVRLFQRKYGWLRLHKMNYSEIGLNLVPFLDELVACNLLLSIEHLDELETALSLLSVNEIKNIGKIFNLNITGKNKKEITDMLLKHSKQKPLFGSQISGHMTQLIKKRVILALNSCYKLSQEPRRLFIRIMMLFSLPFIQEEEIGASGGFQQQLFTLLMVDRGSLIFPQYKILRQAVLFTERDALIRYEAAKQLENEINTAMESKNFHLAFQFYQTAEKEYNSYSQIHLERDASLPDFLRCFTTGWVYIKCLSKGVEVLQRLKRYNEAVELLQKLLNQMIYCQDYRGRWWDRMALNLDQHLKETEKSLNMLWQGLADQQVRTGHRFSLFARARRLCGSFLKNSTSALADFEFPTVREANKVVIQGCLLPNSIQGHKSVFISKLDLSESEDAALLSVEELALQHYKANGFTQGIHGESSTLISLFALLFWDVIYGGEHSDVFRSPYQSYPLDLNTAHFFTAREKEITDRLDFVRNSTMNDLLEQVKITWESEHGKSSLVQWERFIGCSQIQGLIRCIGNCILTGICERLAKDFRHCRSGVPDLIVWNPENLNLKIVEVKGPGDHLSPKQIMWLDYLLTLGTDAEVCHVEATSAKRLAKP